MESIGSHVLDFWVAFDSVEPIGDEWEQTACIRESLASVFGALIVQKDNTVEPATAMDFMPARYIRDQEPIEEDPPAVMDPVEEFKMFGRLFGFTEEQLESKGH